MSRKKTTDEFKQEVFDLVGDEYSVVGEYINSRIKIIFKHNVCGKTFEMIPTGFLSAGYRCRYCAYKKIGESKRKTTDEFKQEVFDLVGDEYSVVGEYINASTPIEIKHNVCNNINLQRPQNFLNGHRCNYCNGSFKKSLDEFKQEVFDLVGDEYSVVGEYVNTNTKILMRHYIDVDTFHTFEILPYKFLSGTRCTEPSCYYSALSNTQRMSTAEFKKAVYNLVGDEYSVETYGQNTFEKVKFIHNDCKKSFMMRPNNFISGGQRCPHCVSRTTSKAEIEIYNFLKSFYTGTITKNYRTKNKNEIDIYLPKEKIGIEYDGLYWHSDNFLDPKYHLTKMLFYKQKGIKIINIFEDEWLNKKELVKDKIRHIIGYSTKAKVYARKCTVSLISAYQKNLFLEENHIQGGDKSNIKLGLYNNNELIAVMTFGKFRSALGSKKTNNSEYELIRYASSKIVLGGFGKLLKYFIRNYEPTKIKTFADLRWSNQDNTIYSIYNFKLSHISAPNYYYTKGVKKYHRYSFRKQVLQEKLPDLYDINLTEFEIMNKSLYNRIWDCGNLVYELNID